MINLPELAKEIEAAKNWIGVLPESHQWTEDELAALEEIRHAALGLAHEAETAIELFEGR